jgi:hypothetical protein
MTTFRIGQPVRTTDGTLRGTVRGALLHGGYLVQLADGRLAAVAAKLLQGA